MQQQYAVISWDLRLTLSTWHHSHLSLSLSSSSAAAAAAVKTLTSHSFHSLASIVDIHVCYVLGNVVQKTIYWLNLKKTLSYTMYYAADDRRMAGNDIM